MTIGSPFASASGPGVAEMNARRVPSGDQASRTPDEGSGWLVPSTGAINCGPEPSALATISPEPAAMWPMKASRLPSGEKVGSLAVSPSPPRRRLAPLATLNSHTCE